MRTRCWFESLEGRSHAEDVRVDERIVFKLIVRGRGFFIWLRIGTEGGILWKPQWTFGFHKACGISWPDERIRPTSFQEGLGSKEQNLSSGCELEVHGPQGICKASIKSTRHTFHTKPNYLQTLKIYHKFINNIDSNGVVHLTWFITNYIHKTQTIFVTLHWMKK
jgi:hypothetical protein